MTTPSCKICSHTTRVIAIPDSTIKYYACTSCDFIFIDEHSILSKEEEERRYRLHDNTLENEGYVDMLNDFIKKSIAPHKSRIKSALDFGCGPAPVLATLLRNNGLDVDIYDKLFAPDEVFRDRKYDLITTTEVLEHLRDPVETIKLLRGLINKNGIISIMTQFHPQDDQRFIAWWYRRDRTHIAFYTPRTIACIAEKYNMKIKHCDAKKICVLESV